MKTVAQGLGLLKIQFSFVLKQKQSWVWWYPPLISALGRWGRWISVNSRLVWSTNPGEPGLHWNFVSPLNKHLELREVCKPWQRNLDPINLLTGIVWMQLPLFWDSLRTGESASGPKTSRQKFCRTCVYALCRTQNRFNHLSWFYSDAHISSKIMKNASEKLDFRGKIAIKWCVCACVCVLEQEYTLK